jgi:hypothetical protein
METFAVIFGVTIVLSLLSGGLASSAKAQARGVRPDQFGDHIFHQKQWLLVLSLCGLAASGVGMAALVIFRPVGWWFFAAVVGLFFFATSLGVGLDYVLASVEIRGSDVLYRRLFKRKPFSLSAISLCRVRGGYVVVHLVGNRIRMIPLTFRDSGLLLAMLQNYRPPTEKPKQATQPSANRPYA